MHGFPHKPPCGHAQRAKLKNSHANKQCNLMHVPWLYWAKHNTAQNEYSLSNLMLGSSDYCANRQVGMHDAQNTQTPDQTIKQPT